MSLDLNQKFTPERKNNIKKERKYFACSLKLCTFASAFEGVTPF